MFLDKNFDTTELKNELSFIESTDKKSTLNGSKTSNSNVNKNCSKILYDLELNLEQILQSNKQSKDEKNKLIYYAKNYNIYKKIFEDMTIKVFPEYSKFLNKIITGIHEVITNFAAENRNLKENYDLTMKSNKTFITYLEYSNLSKQFDDTSKLIEEKDNEILKLKKKIGDMEMKLSELESKKYNNTTDNCLFDKEEQPKNSTNNLSINSLIEKEREDEEAKLSGQTKHIISKTKKFYFRYKSKIS